VHIRPRHPPPGRSPVSASLFLSPSVFFFCWICPHVCILCMCVYPSASPSDRLRVSGLVSSLSGAVVTECSAANTHTHTHTVLSPVFQLQALPIQTLSLSSQERCRQETSSSARCQPHALASARASASATAAAGISRWGGELIGATEVRGLSWSLLGCMVSEDRALGLWSFGALGLWGLVICCQKMMVVLRVLAVGLPAVVVGDTASMAAYACPMFGDEESQGGISAVGWEVQLVGRWWGRPRGLEGKPKGYAQGTE
jgi:hypothetical protein